VPDQEQPPSACSDGARFGCRGPLDNQRVAGLAGLDGLDGPNGELVELIEASPSS